MRAYGVYRHRRLWTILVVCAAFARGESRSAEPAYQAQVTGINSFALSGPGPGYYPTHALRRGDSVTVVGQRYGNWVAIAPPAGSFSWLPTSAVEEQDDGSGLVTVDEVQVRVGSQLSSAHHVFQAILRKGDRVEILDRVYLKDDGVPQWYKIVSPRDEVRYVAIDQLTLPGPAAGDGYGSLNPDQPSIPQQAPAANPIGNVPTDGQVRLVTNRVIPPAQPIGGSSRSDVPIINTSGPVRGEQAEAPNVNDATPVTMRDDPSLPFDERLKAFDKQLQLMKTLEPRTWDVAAARSLAQTLHAEATTPEQRAEAANLLADIGRLETLEQQFGRVLKQRELTLQKDAELEALQRRLQNQSQRTAPRFTAEGVLDEGTLAIDGQASFILKDREGYTTHYVLPAPGMNVDSYVGRKVGLFGEVSKRDNLPSPVLVVEQLTPMDG